jgi:hypothetical protein
MFPPKKKKIESQSPKPISGFGSWINHIFDKKKTPGGWGIGML